jgi:hypothetical protein
METGHLLHLASIVSPTLPIRAAAVHAVFAGRAKEGGQGDFIDPKRVASLEPRVGRACLDALVAFNIPEDVSIASGFRKNWATLTRISRIPQKLHPEVGSVWEYKEKPKHVDLPIS